MKKSNFNALLFISIIFCLPYFGRSQTIIWQNDFSDPSQWSTYNFSGDQQNWSITSVSSNTIGFNTGSWVDQNNTVSNENGYALFDSDALYNGNLQDAVIAFSGLIDLTNYQNVSLKFNQRIRMWQTTQTKVEVSPDGGSTWTAFPINENKPLTTIFEEVVHLDISSVAGGQSNVMIRFRFTGEYEYLWMIDDITLMVPALNDLSLNSVSFGSTGSWGTLKYFQIPLSQIAPIEVSGNVSNYGLNDQSNVVFSANVAQASFSSSSPATELTSFQTIDLSTTEPLILPSQLGIYNLSSVVTGVGENDLENNIILGPSVKVTNNIYSRDDGTLDGSFGIQGQAIEAGNIFDIFSQTLLEGIQFYVHPNSSIGSTVYVKLYTYDFNTGDFVTQGSSAFYQLTSDDIGNFITLPLLAPVNLNANESYLAVAGIDGNCFVGRSGFSEPYTTFSFDVNAGSWYWTTSRPMVRMVLNSSQSIVASICEGESYTLNDEIYTESGLYLQTLTSQDFSDSIVTLNLTVLQFETVPILSEVTPSNCSSPTGSITLSNPPISGSSVYFSEYYSGSGENNVIEIYNPTSAPIDLGCPGGCSFSLKLVNSNNQEFVIPQNTILQPYSSILISHPNSAIQGQLQTYIVDGSTIYGVVVYPAPFGSTIESLIDVANTVSGQTFIRRPNVTTYNSNYTAGEWLTKPASENSLGTHLWTDFYNVLWSDGTSGDVLLNVPAGTYSYQIIYEESVCSDQSETFVIPNTGNNFNTNFSSNQQLYTAPPFAVQFSNTTPNPSTYSFVWDFGDGTTLASNNLSVFHQYLFNGLYTVTLIATDNQTGCSDTTTISDYIFCTGGVSCTHTAAINQQGPIEECAGTDVWLTCNNDPSYTYQWRRNGINIPGNDNDSLLVTQSGNYTVTIFVNNCPVTSNAISVTINPLPAIPTITSTGTITSCSGGSLTLSAPSGLTSYSWNTGATTESIVVTQSGNYAVTVTNVNGCTRTSAPYVVNASFMSSPNVCVVGMDSLTNENRIVWEKPLTTGIDSFYVYKETNVSDVYTKIGATDYPDLAVFLDQNSNPAVQAYRYKLTVLDTCGTETPLSDFHKTIHLTINAGVGGAWNLIWSHYEGLTFGSYNIYRGTDPTNISLLTSIQSNLNSYTDLAPPVGPVYYQIEIVNPNSCDPTKVINYSVSRSNIVNNGVNGINALWNSTIIVYPNPTSKDVTLEITSELLGKDYFLTDNTGRIILTGQFRALKETVNLEQLATGVYFIKIDNKANLMYKIVKN